MSLPATDNLRRCATNWRLWLLLALAAQFAALQLATGVEYLDAPRNLHWGLYLLEQPRFLLDADDSYDRIHGFVPSPPALAIADALVGRSAPLHPWWGPLYLMLFAAAWQLSGSYTLLRLVSPVAAGAVVLGTYAFGARYFGRRAGLLAAGLLALFPLFREHATMAFAEPISALVLGAALWAFLARRTAWAMLLGALAMLGKIDMIALFFGSVLALVIWPGRPDAERMPRKHVALSLAAPLLVLLPWLALTRLVFSRPATVAGGPSLAVFRALAPLMLDQFFTLARIPTIATLALLAALAAWAWLRRGAARPAVYRMLAVWAAGGVAVLLVYSAAPGASNNPRVLIPALPPIVLLIADALARLPRIVGRAALAYVLVLFVLADAAGLCYQVLEASALNATMPVWAALGGQPRGFVLTDQYWEATLYARQPATWFENDPAFQHAILWDRARFQQYVAANDIRYVVLPRDDRLNERRLNEPLARWYARLPLGRALGWPTAPLVSPQVRQYLAAQPSATAGDYIIFTLGKPELPSKQGDSQTGRKFL